MKSYVMKFRVITCLLLMSLYSCSFFFEDTNSEGYRNGSGSGPLINEGSLIGNWEQTSRWITLEHAPSHWEPVNIKTSDSYVFYEDGTFISSNVWNECSSNEGKYTISGKSIILKYVCDTVPETTEEIFIDEFFFTESHAVLIRKAYSMIYKMELKEN